MFRYLKSLGTVSTFPSQLEFFKSLFPLPTYSRPQMQGSLFFRTSGNRHAFEKEKNKHLQNLALEKGVGKRVWRIIVLTIIIELGKRHSRGNSRWNFLCPCLGCHGLDKMHLIKSVSSKVSQMKIWDTPLFCSICWLLSSFAQKICSCCLLKTKR